MDKIIFQVVEVNGEKLFKVSGKKKILFLNKILPTWFEGYYHCTKCQIIRNGELYDDGYVNYHGTHCATDYFFGFKIVIAEQMSSEILSESLEPGDILEIENMDKPNCQSYASVNKFIDYIVHLQKFSQSMNEVFKLNEGKLSGQEFIDALINCSVGINNEARAKVVVVRL